MTGVANPAVPGNPCCHVLFDQPVIPPNTGNAIRMCAGTGAALHLAGPLGFNFDDRHVKRAGLDYHDLASVTLHENRDAALTALADRGGHRVFAFTTRAETWYTDIRYEPGDVLLFGTEPTGLEQEALDDPRVTAQVRIPMLPGRRSMNLSNAAAVAAHEAWRQLGFPGAVRGRLD
ncbi:tRNA (cytidine(34)-2'-O)-methyltransferase [uncultured Corynebacterium sp.]|uniref:tRNA (cytidine(34)-2'-O)-methyltransferase n=1 Tax=uncultured Corynebacterium sp. TaxID=159447 RepID=UPI0025F1A6DD|nr:tRNA (cytidine(34)-2'-O)-methyltransferase [uncultured Corynebacterium sp.]